MSNNKNFIAKNGVSTGDGYAMPDIRPSLLLDFANSKTLDPRITFTRGSTATYWDGHTTTKAEENLSLYSQSISNLTQNNTTATDNDATAPDGTTTATKIVVGSTTNKFHDAYLSPQATVSGTAYTHSVYVKAGTGISAVYLYTTITGVGLVAKFNISTGAYIGNASGDGYGAFDSYSITDVGNSWYRIQATKTETASNSSRAFTLGVSNTTTDDVQSYNGNGTDFCHVWGVQIEQRSSATAYTATTSSPIVKYQPTLQTAASGEARFDHDPVTGESKGLLIEEARTNLVSNSEDINTWNIYFNGNKRSNQVIAPDGTLTGDEVENWTGSAGSGLGVLRIPTGATLSASTTYAISLWLKSDTSGATVDVQLGDNTLLNDIALTDEWVRYTAVGSPAQNSYNFIDIEFPTGMRFFVWGVQVEEAAFPTSYIATSGSTVARSPDDASFSSSNLDTWFPQLAGDTNSGGSYYFEWDSLGIVGSNDWSCLWRNANTGERMGMYEQSNGLVYVEGEISSSAQFSINTGTAVSGVNRLAASIKHNDFAASLNGGTAVTDTSGRVPSELNTFYFGWYTTDNSLQSHIKKFAFYPQRLSNATLQQMTEE